MTVFVVGAYGYELYSGERCEVPIPTIGIVPTIHAFRVTQVMFQYVYIHFYSTDLVANKPPRDY